MEVEDSNYHVSDHTDDVMNRWEKYFENLFSNSTKTHYDDNHQGDIKQLVQNNTVVPSLDTNISLLNEPVTSEEVENSLYRAKLNRAPGVDAIPAEDCEIRFALIYCIGLLTFVLKTAPC